jgi:hypothetical protein
MPMRAATCETSGDRGERHRGALGIEGLGDEGFVDEDGFSGGHRGVAGVKSEL